jgi:hypothetical protein
MKRLTITATIILSTNEDKHTLVEWTGETLANIIQDGIGYPEWLKVEAEVTSSKHEESENSPQ